MSKQIKTTIGGQALLEGIMMRGPDKTAAVVRKPDGTFAVRETPTTLPKDKFPVLGWFLIRGVVGFVASMKAGMNLLMWSAEVAMEEETDNSEQITENNEEKTPNAPPKSEGMGAFGLVTMLFSLVLAIGLFTVLPTLIGGWLGLAQSHTRNLVETGFRLVILIGYMLLVSRMKDIQRTFSYHGAEHKTIACYEAGDTLTVENVRKYTRFHPRCGTSFLLMVVIVSLICFFLVSSVFPGLPWGDPVLRILMRLCLLPFVVGFAYEINRLTGKFDNPLTMAIRAPGIALQHLTTNEPTDDMIEVGIDALTRVIPAEAGKDIWA